jgi:polyamine oxidase
LLCRTDSFDWEFAENPDVTSNNYAQVGDASYDGSFGPNSDGDEFVIDQRGFKYIFLQEAKQFLKPNDPRLLLNTTVKNIKYSNSGVVITAKDGSKIEADYAISTFRCVLWLGLA